MYLRLLTFDYDIQLVYTNLVFLLLVMVLRFGYCWSWFVLVGLSLVVFLSLVGFA